jgi:hypothetical protein
VSPEDGASVAADEPVTFEFDVQGAELSGPDAGHFDIRVDGQLETMTPEPNPDITFKSGEHVIDVEYVNRQHQSFDPPVTAQTTVTAE